MITNKHQPVPFRLTTRKSDKKRPRVLSRLTDNSASDANNNATVGAAGSANNNKFDDNNNHTLIYEKTQNDFY